MLFHNIPEQQHTRKDLCLLNVSMIDTSVSLSNSTINSNAELHLKYCMFFCLVYLTNIVCAFDDDQSSKRSSICERYSIRATKTK